MVKLVIAKVDLKKGRRPVDKRQVRGPGGRTMDMFTVDTSSNTFDDDIARVFKRNIHRVREANTIVFGSPDGVQKAPEKRKLSGLADGVAKK